MWKVAGLIERVLAVWVMEQAEKVLLAIVVTASRILPQWAHEDAAVTLADSGVGASRTRLMMMASSNEQFGFQSRVRAATIGSGLR